MKKMLRKLYQRLPIVKELLQINANLAATRVACINSFLRSELSSARYKDPRKLNHYEHEVFSQNGEDGIMAEIFRRIGTQSRFFVEFGTGDGLENNTSYLLTQNWRGCWIEGNPQSAESIRTTFQRPLREGRLKFRNSFITAENIDSLFSELEVPVQFDLLSLDIDRNTYHVWKALSRFQPRVVAIEYNATFPADVEWIAEYEPQRGWNNTMYFGASLKAYERLGTAFGYALVGCDLSGTNAFFIRNTEKLELFAEPFTAENHYEPPRYWSSHREAHARCFDDRVS